MKVLVTGGAGRLGINVCKILRDNGYRVRVFDLDTQRNRSSVKELGRKAETIWGDITNRESVRKAMEGVDAVVHMAAILPPLADENPKLCHKVNVGGTRIVIDLLKEKDKRIPFIFTSSVTVFGPTPFASEPVSVEGITPCPQEPYAETKLEAENLIKNSGIDYLILRLTAIMYFNFEISDLKRIFSIPLNNRIEFCHPDDLSLAILNGIKNFNPLQGNTLVISGGPEQRMLYKDMVGKILGVIGLPLPPAEKFTTEPYCLDWYDTSQSQKMLKFQSKTFADYLTDYSRGLNRKYGLLFIPWMRYFVSPLFGKIVVQFM